MTDRHVMRVLRRIGISLAGVIAAYFIVAISVMYWPSAVFGNQPVPTRAQFAARERASGVITDQIYPFREHRFMARDGVMLFARVFGGSAPRTIVLLHGVTSDSSAMNATAGAMAEATGAQVIALDFRGHGRSGGTPWQVAYVGQYEDDVADVIQALRALQPHGKIILAGHSMGGGVAQRYALKPQAPAVDGYLLFAPLLGGQSPTLRSAQPAPAGNAGHVYFRTARFLGAAMLHVAGVRAFDRLPILYFNEPGAPAYGLAALISMQPNDPWDYGAALRAIKVPLLVVVGSKDEVFNAAAFPSVVQASGHPHATSIIEGSTHNGVLHDPRTLRIVTSWVATI